MSSLLTVSISFITEVQSQSSEISVKRAKEGAKNTHLLTNKNLPKAPSLHFVFFIEHSDAKEIEGYYLIPLLLNLSDNFPNQAQSNAVVNQNRRNGPGGI
jgi:hypothetical protein